MLVYKRVPDYWCDALFIRYIRNIDHYEWMSHFNVIGKDKYMTRLQ